MDKSELTEVIGVITYRDKPMSGQIVLAVRDKEGRLLSIEYNYHSSEVASSIYHSLEVGMSVKLYIDGPISPTEVDYSGVGIITVIDKGGESGTK